MTNSPKNVPRTSLLSFWWRFFYLWAFYCCGAIILRLSPRPSTWISIDGRSHTVMMHISLSQSGTVLVLQDSLGAVMHIRIHVSRQLLDVVRLCIARNIVSVTIRLAKLAPRRPRSRVIASSVRSSNRIQGKIRQCNGMASPGRCLRSSSEHNLNQLRPGLIERQIFESADFPPVRSGTWRR